MADSYILSTAISSIHIDDWFILLGVAFSGILSFFLLTLSLQQASPTLISSIRSFELVMATAVSAILANSSPTIPVIFGVLLITTGILFLTFHSELTKSLKKWTSLTVNSRHSNSFRNNYGSIWTSVIYEVYHKQNVQNINCVDSYLDLVLPGFYKRLFSPCISMWVWAWYYPKTCFWHPSQYNDWIQSVWNIRLVNRK